jgi:methylase of polypeptide subunit release factors
VEVHEGDLFAPVAGRRFGLVVSNPPYVISPDNRCIFMDSGRPGDTISADVVRGVPAHLEEGGYATVLCNWALREGESWSEPLRRWVEGLPCDAWLLEGGEEDALSYAAVWNRGREDAAYGAALDRWRDYYREAGIARIGMGAVILRRRKGNNWVRADVLPEDPASPCGEQIVRIFEAEDALSRLQDDDALLARAFRLVDEHRLDQTLRLEGERFAIQRAEVKLASGFGFRGRVDAATLQLLQHCDGRTPLRVLAEELGRAAPGAEVSDPERVKAPLAGTVRKMVSMGFLVPA